MHWAIEDITFFFSYSCLSGPRVVIYLYYFSTYECGFSHLPNLEIIHPSTFSPGPSLAVKTGWLNRMVAMLAPVLHEMRLVSCLVLVAASSGISSTATGRRLT